MPIPELIARIAVKNESHKPLLEIMEARGSDIFPQIRLRPGHRSKMKELHVQKLLTVELNNMM